MYQVIVSVSNKSSKITQLEVVGIGLEPMSVSLQSLQNYRPHHPAFQVMAANGEKMFIRTNSLVF